MVVEPMEAFGEVVTSGKIRLAMLAVPADSAQRVADQVVAAGIRGILNFAPVPITVPPQVNLVGVALSIPLENLAYKVQRTEDEDSCAGAIERGASATDRVR